MILIFTLLGLIAAVAAYFFFPPHYESSARLLVRYVLDRSSVDSIDGATNSTANSKNTDAIIGSEIAILTSWDLAVQVAEALGTKRLLPKSTTAPSKEAAAATVSAGLVATATKGSNIILVTYQSSDPELAPLILNELLNRYFVKHLEVHRSAGAFDFVTQQTDQVRARLGQTEDALKNLKAKVGIISLADGTATLSAELAKTEEQLHLAEADLAEQRAQVKEMHPALPTSPTGAAAAAPPASAGGVPGQSPAAPPKEQLSERVLQQYLALVARLAQLEKSKGELLTKYTPGSVMVQVTQTQIHDLQNDKESMEKKYPDLPSRAASKGSEGKAGEVVTESARLAGMEAKTEALRSRAQETLGRMRQLTELAPEIGDLERKKELEEANYKYFENTLEKARVDEALDPSKIPNISAVQRPTPPAMVTALRNKLTVGLAVGGLMLGIALALLRDLVLSHAVKRPSQLEAQLHTSLLLSIPDASSNGHLALPKTGGSEKASLVVRSQRGTLAPWDAGHFMRKYSEAIRDRIGLYFELNHLTHKPKLVGVTSFSHGAGTSTLAASLAAALSETDDGKVLLVDVNLGPGDVHPFFKGKPAYSLTTALQPPNPIDPVADNLYLASVGNGQAGLATLGLKKFFDLMPNLRASDFDYIIFDMPPLTSTSQSWGMAAFMDKLLLVVEAEKSSREVVKRGYAKLMSERNNVSVVLNKTRSYIPKSLDNEI